MLHDARHRDDRLGASSPSFTNSGATRSSTESRASATSRRIAGVRRSRRMRRAGNVTPTRLPPSAPHGRSRRRRNGEQGGDEAVDGVRIGFGVDAQAAFDRGGRRDRPIETTSGNGSGRGPTAAQKLSTVDDDVNVTASNAALDDARPPVSGSGVAGPVRYTGSTSTVVAASRESFGEHVARDLGARQRHARARCRRRRERLEQRLGDEALGDEVGAQPRVGSARAVPGPMAATRTPASARASSPAGARPSSKNASHAVGRREHQPFVGGEVGHGDGDGRDRDRGQLDHLGARAPRGGGAARSPARAPG